MKVCIRFEVTAGAEQIRARQIRVLRWLRSIAIAFENECRISQLDSQFFIDSLILRTDPVF